MSEKLQYRVWTDIACALEYLHSQHIIHLDIKPENILLGGHERAILRDFELANIGAIECTPSKIPPKFLAGTPSYILPELLLHTELGAPGDICAFGVTLLFVFRQIPLPNEKWIIAKVYSGATTQQEMSTWVKCILCVVKKLPKRLSLLRQVLIAQRNPREANYSFAAIY